MSGVEVRAATASDAGVVLDIIRAGFAGRPPLDPPPPALAEDEDSVRRALADQGGLLAVRAGEAVGTLLFERPEPQTLGLRRVAVAPQAQGAGVAQAMVAAAERYAVQQGVRRTSLTARVELPATVEFWRRQGYHEIARAEPLVTLAKALPAMYKVRTAEQTQALAEQLALALIPGDLVVLIGDLGAGKTTFTQGLARGLQVRGSVTSPTFVIARVHPSLVGGPSLVHVDAYRLGGIEELDDLDLDTSLAQAVTVVEWGAGLAESLSDSRLEVELTRPGTPSRADHDEPRTIEIRGLGQRWAAAPLPSWESHAPVS